MFSAAVGCPDDVQRAQQPFDHAFKVVEINVVGGFTAQPVIDTARPGHQNPQAARFIRQFLTVALEVDIADFEQLLERPRSVAFVAERGDALAGFIAGNIERNLPDRLPEEHATVGYLWVEPAFRRRGLARLLFEEVAGWARDQEGISHFEMAVLSADSAAAGFWRSIGFTPFIERLWAPLSAPERDA